MKFSARFSIGFVLAVVLLSAAPSWSQTANTGIVLGTVVDAKGGVVPDAKVDLTNAATNETKTVQTNGAGQYVFPNVTPGTYTLKIAKSGFASVTFSNITVSVTKSYTYDATLEVSSGKEIVEVTAGAAAELQTTDAVVGGVIGGQTLTHLPTLQRDTRELLTLQPGSTPYETNNGGGFGDSGGTVAGARSDQNAFNLDGIDITDGSKLLTNFVSASPTTMPASAAPPAGKSMSSARAAPTLSMAPVTGSIRIPLSMPTPGTTAIRPTLMQELRLPRSSHSTTIAPASRSVVRSGKIRPFSSATTKFAVSRNPPKSPASFLPIL